LRGKEKTIVPQSVPGERLDWKVQQGIILPLNARGEYKNGLFAGIHKKDSVLSTSLDVFGRLLFTQWMVRLNQKRICLSFEDAGVGKV
jgi:hypothetical protein